ncbi:hypothetical protein AX660_22265 [Paraglaciecola hydrolytica]|uniref:Uncharacterized protein n=1 Tax=Paraglaciecola hydrolytica TaxID=1799789 RepID=A0A148KMA7_9ALTE|nr:hypothetical protein AX660_22265 [Paraglaciecola hydrolytica]
MPSVTIVNKSGNVIEQVEVALPSSNLNLGALRGREENTLHYHIYNKTMVFITTNIKVKVQLCFVGIVAI